jgi:serine acetyltransferase
MSSNSIFREILAAISDPTPLEHTGEKCTLAGALRADVEAVMNRDPACDGPLAVLLFFKGFSAIVAQRTAHRCWVRGDRVFALYLQSRASEVCGVDIHPGARLGAGLMLDHGTGVVIGETSVVGDGCTFLHGVTLGGTGKVCVLPHLSSSFNQSLPVLWFSTMATDTQRLATTFFLERAAWFVQSLILLLLLLLLLTLCLVYFFQKVLGNITVGNGAKIGCASVVLRPVPSHATAVGLIN